MHLSTTRLALALSFLALLAAPAHATLTVSPVTWNIIGLDSNSPANGPHLFPVGARVCSDVATTNVAVNFVFDTANANVNIRAGSFTGINIPSIGAGQCADAYFDIDVTQTAAAFDTARRYHITATDFSGTASTVTPRELYVEHLISQNRNAITDVKYGPDLAHLTSVAAGGSMNLVVGDSYTIQLLGSTATPGYNQFESFIGFPNTIFQILGVQTQYSADDSPSVPNPNDKLYADACQWQNDPNSPLYRNCIGGDFKAGGANVITTYTIKIIGGGGTSPTLNALLYDFSGSSFDYNSDFSAGARIANIIDPTTANISKSFTPNPAALNGISALKFTLTNPNGGALGGYNFVDNLPANLVVATPPGASTSGCGAPTLTANAGASSISFSGGSVAANSTCVITVNVTPTATGTLNNTTNHLFIDTVDTTHSASASLTVNNPPPPGTGLCGGTLALWDFPTGFNITNPVATTANVPASAAAGPGIAPKDTTHDSTLNPAGGSSWGSNGAIAGGATLDTSQNDYFEFAVNTTGVIAISLSFDAEHRGLLGPTGVAVWYGTSPGNPETGTQVFNNNNALPAQNTWVHFSGGGLNINTGLNPSGNTFFRIYGFNAGNQTAGSDIEIDHVLFTGCVPAVKPTIAKAFNPATINLNGVSTLTFTLTNTNASPLTGAAFGDNLPSGTQVAATPNASTTCAGATWAPAAGNTTLTFSAGTIPASGSCTAQVDVTATTSGPHGNTSGFLNTTEGGTNTASIASASLSATNPPSIAKLFGPNPILANAVSHLTFTITNPNENDTLSGVNFGDTFPTSPGNMVVANPPNATTNGCGAPTFSPVAGAGSITFSGGAIAGAGTCLVTVDVTAPATGTYNNTSAPVSYIINAQTVNGTTASASLTANPPNPSIHLLKQVGPSNSGPWSTFLPITAGNNVFYQFTVENTGDVPLTSITLTDDTVNVSSCNASFSGVTLPVAVAGNNNHIIQCVAGPIASTNGVHTNTAHSSGIFNATPVNSPNSSATYATTSLTLAKSVTETTFTNAGDVLHYSYLVTNSGFAPLGGPVTVSDDHATVTCPPVSSVGDLDNFLDPGEAITCTATYTITGTDISNAGVTNTASASAGGVTSNNSSKFVPLSTSADVSVDKTLSVQAQYVTGGTVTYTLTVANAGPSTATNIQVTDTPSNLTITNVSGSGCAALPCTIASLASGANTTITVTATINAAGAFDNSATATASQPDPNPANNTDNTNNGGTAVNSADLSITKSPNTPAPYHHGNTITFDLTVHNNGPSTANNVVVFDNGIGLTPSSMTGGNCTGATISGNQNQNITCTIASLASGETQTVTVTETINAPGAFQNNATVSADETDPDSSNNSAQVNLIATTSADISVVKSITTAGPYYAGETITYTLTVHNNGASASTQLVVNDTPTNMTIVSASSNDNAGNHHCDSLPCTFGSPLANTHTVIITVTATINADGAFSNTATVSGNDFDPDTSNNSSTAGGTAGPTADLSVTKTATTNGPYHHGDTITFDLTVHNNGPATATNVVVFDNGIGLAPSSMTGGNCTGASISGNQNQNITCTIASLASGATAVVSVTETITAPGAFQNNVTVSATEIDPDSSNNTAQVNLIATTQADISVVKSISTPGPYYIGETITYTLTVHNNGASASTQLHVTDTPTNMTILTSSSNDNAGNHHCDSFPCTFGSPLANTHTVVITVTATITGLSFSNTSTVSGNDFDPDTSNNSSTAGGEALPSADVSMVKTLTTSGPFNAGQSVSYTLTVANAGPSTATSIQVTDTPTNLTVTNVSGSGCAALPCTIASLASGANTTINVTATINGSGTFDNSATATALEFDPNTANNTDNTGNGGSTASADISIVKTLTTSGPFTAGQTINYTLVVANAGPSTATNIHVTDTPTNLTIGTVSGGGCSALPCTIGSIASGANLTINVAATITAAGAFDNSATVAGTEFDPNSANNTDNSGNGGTASAAPSVDVSVVKTPSSSTIKAGQALDFTIVVTNNGAGTATGVTVTDPLPANFSALSANSTQGSCSGTTTITCNVGTLNGSASATITIHGLVLSPTNMSNTATVTINEADAVPSNNSSTALVNVVADIPAMNDLVLMMLALALAIAGAMFVRKM